MNTYNALNQPWKAGSLEIKNRIGVAPITGGAMYRPEGGFTDTAINYFSLRAGPNQ
ncbi:MAG: hypothetical protein ACI4UH_06395 [Dorea sp.]